MPGPALPCGLQGCGHLRDACPLMLCDLKVVRSRRSAVLSGNRRRSVRSPVALNDLFVSVAVRHDDEPQVRHRDVQRDYRRLVSADVLPKRVGVPNMIPSAHSASADVGPPYSASICLLRSQPGTLAMTAGVTISGTRRSRTSA